MSGLRASPSSGSGVSTASAVSVAVADSVSSSGGGISRMWSSVDPNDPLFPRVSELLCVDRSGNIKAKIAELKASRKRSASTAAPPSDSVPSKDDSFLALPSDSATTSWRGLRRVPTADDAVTPAAASAAVSGSAEDTSSSARDVGNDFIPLTSDSSSLKRPRSFRDDASSSLQGSVVSAEKLARERERRDALSRVLAKLSNPSIPFATHLYSHLNLTLRLHEEILDFVAYLSPRVDEHRLREQLISKLRELVLSLWPGATVVPFGSFASGLYLPLGDVDVCIFNGADGKGQTKLEILASALESRGLCSSMEVIKSARVPIIKYVDKATAIRVDISFDVESGVTAVGYLRGQAKLFPAFRPLTLLLKYFLHCRLLNDTYSGGIGSFLLQCLILSSLQLAPTTRLHTLNEVNLGVLLLAFFELYGRQLNFYNVGISLRQGGRYFQKAFEGWLNEARPHMLAVENPLDTDHDIAANSFAIVRARRVFFYAYQRLCDTCYGIEFSRRTQAERAGKRPASLLAAILSVDDDMLDARPLLHCFPRQSGVDVLSLSNDEDDLAMEPAESEATLLEEGEIPRKRRKDSTPKATEVAVAADSGSEVMRIAASRDEVILVSSDAEAVDTEGGEPRATQSAAAASVSTPRHGGPKRPKPSHSQPASASPAPSKKKKKKKKKKKG